MPQVAIEIVNSKFEVKQKDAQRLSKLSNENQFTKILDSKVELNYKIAKILANALNWKIDFNAFRSNGKQTIMIPIKKDATAKVPPTIIEPIERDLFKEIEGNRQDVQLPMITEEKPGATGTNETLEHN